MQSSRRGLLLMSLAVVPAVLASFQDSPAQLKIVLQKGKLIGYLTYEDFEETLAVTVSAPSKIQLKGVSVRDLQGAGRGFDLETLNAELSPDGRRLSGTTGTRSRFEFRRKS